ncbi:antifreeze protein [Xinfangfangia sp. D13-10-4-6]|uniref:antifreeze protein n=1 Tax=Pseudogemmobacter hezensis TaxID=2737662 RepID=UPI00155571CF|nr:antifreeze protein [Pseudogemmobacter hezensis]NPD15970.1 antifreeze protein [Pseudogemmobacter hezensis]
MFPFMPPSPSQMMRLGLRSSVMLAEAQAVIAMRMAGMMGIWPVSPDENARMISEKLAALQEAHVAVMTAAMKGASPTAMAEAALRPVRRRTKANAARLARQISG